MPPPKVKNKIQDSTTVLATSASTVYDEEWSVAKLLNDRENFVLLLAVIIIVLILAIFFITVGCCLCKSRAAVNKAVYKQ